MHKRLFPKINAFNYGIYYLSCPLSRLHEMQDGWRFGVNRGGILSFYEKDHGARDGGSLAAWARNILAEHNIAVDGEITLVCMPCVLGYVFNPVSFWLCHDKSGDLRAVLCEVNNTFGETHSYLCYHADHRKIEKDDWLEAQKVFHVSPFLPREGHYKFRFNISEDSLGIWIDYYAADGQKQLLTALTGTLLPYTRQNLRHAFWQHPLVTLMAVARIHKQAIHLVFKGIRYISKPKQLDTKLTHTRPK